MTYHHMPLCIEILGSDFRTLKVEVFVVQLFIHLPVLSTLFLWRKQSLGVGLHWSLMFEGSLCNKFQPGHCCLRALL